MALTVRQTTAGQAWIARRNHAVGPLQARRVVITAAIITIVIAFVFSAFGAWPVLPFAGIEVAALWLALRHVQRHSADEERIDVDEAQITVTHRIAGRCEQHHFSRYWAQVRLERPAASLVQHLYLRSHGRELEIGRMLTDSQKQTLADELKKKPEMQYASLQATRTETPHLPTEEGT